MQKTSTSTAIILETRTPLKDGRYPVKLRITHNRQSRYFSLKDEDGRKIALDKSEYGRVKGSKPRGENKTLAIFLNEIEKTARETIDELPLFSFESFENRFFGRHGDEQDLFTALQNSINRLKNTGRISTSKSYECALNSLKLFTGKKVLPFERVNISFLESYEKWMEEEKNSPTTTGIYIRYIRTCFNEAIDKGTVKREMYPFGKRKYRIPVGRNIKKALSQEDIGLIASYQCLDGTSEQRSRDYWLFLLLCNGMYVSDLAHLKYENIKDDVIIFSRQKTSRELRSRPKLIKVFITEQLGRIIDKWGNKPVTPEQFIFPILSETMTPEKIDSTIRQTIKTINKYVKRIAKATKIKIPVTSSHARHTFATLLKRSGASTEFISESLGHTNLPTTENYLADFEISEKRKWANIVEEAVKFKT